MIIYLYIIIELWFSIWYFNENIHPAYIYNHKWRIENVGHEVAKYLKSSHPSDEAWQGREQQKNHNMFARNALTID